MPTAFPEIWVAALLVALVVIRVALWRATIAAWNKDFYALLGAFSVATVTAIVVYA